MPLLTGVLTKALQLNLPGVQGARKQCVHIGITNHSSTQQDGRAGRRASHRAARQCLLSGEQYLATRDNPTLRLTCHSVASA